MSVNIYLNSTILDSAKQMINAIDNRDFSIEHIIVVPDKFSLQMEKLLFTSLKQEAFFNVNVMGLTELAGKILEGNNDSILSSGESLLLTQKAIENVKKDLIVFNKTNISFCYEINKVLMQLKSSLVNGDDLNTEAKGLAGIKFHDLRLIYNEYERLRQKNDANARLSLASERVRNSDIFKNTKIYFAGFDAFTKEAYNLFKALISNTKEVNVSVAKAKSVGNEYIYEKDIFQKIIEIAKTQGGNYQVFESEERFFHQKEAIINGLYSFNKVKCKNDGYYTLFSARSISEEIEGICKIIYDHVTRGYHYSDFSVMLSDVKKYENEIEQQFETFDIPYFIDNSICGDQTILAKTIFAFFNVLTSHYSSSSLKVLFSDILLGKREDLIERIDFYQIDNKFKYKKYIAKDNPFGDALTEIEDCKNSSEFGVVVRKILNLCRDNFSEIMSKLDEKAYLKEKNINLQAREVIEEAVNLIEEYEGEISVGEYEKKLRLLLSFKDVFTVPTFVDGVFVGDATQSSLLDNKIVFIVGGEKLPVVSTDNGFLSDDELLLNFDDKQIQPTIRMINRRNRFKLFNLLTKAQEKLIVSYEVLNEEGKKNEMPSFIESLNGIFEAQPMKMGEQFDFELADGACYALGNRKAFERKYHHVIDEQTKEKLKVDKQKYNKIDKKQIKANGKDIFFGDGKAKVTQLEQYFSCPFKHFARYGLKIKENEVCAFEVKDIGNVCHRGAELFVQKLMKNNFDLSENVENFVDKNFVKILEDERLKDKFEEITEKDSLERFLKNHLCYLINNIKKEMSVSKFRPKYLERKFASMKVGSEGLTLVGKADRIDECGDYLRIIDYKTGSTGKILEQLYFGDKLQLFLYQKIAREELKMRMAGVFYFVAKFDYSKSGEDDKKLLKGLAENDEEVISMLDEKIDISGKSSILSIKTSTKKGYTGSAIAGEKLIVYENYAKRVADKAVDEMCEGFIEPKPDKDSCTFCPYSSICLYEKTDGMRKKEKRGRFYR